MHTKDITKMGGLYKGMPLTALAFLFCAFSVMGIPPFGGFFAKYLVIDGIISAGNVGLGAVFIAGAVMTVLYLSRLFIKVFLGETVSDAREAGSPVMVASVVVLSILSVSLGISIHWPSGFASLIGGGI